MRTGTIFGLFSCLTAAALCGTPAPADPAPGATLRTTPRVLAPRVTILQGPGAYSPGQAVVAPRISTLERYPMPVVVKDPALYPMPVARHNPLQYRIHIVRPGGDAELQSEAAPGALVTPAQPNFELNPVDGIFTLPPSVAPASPKK